MRVFGLLGAGFISRRTSNISREEHVQEEEAGAFSAPRRAPTLSVAFPDIGERGASLTPTPLAVTEALLLLRRLSGDTGRIFSPPKGLKQLI